MPDTSLKMDCVFDVLQAFEDEFADDPCPRRPIKPEYVLDAETLSSYSESEKLIAYRYLLDKRLLELSIPPAQRTRAQILNGPVKHQRIARISSAGYELLNILKSPLKRRKITAISVLDTVCKLLSAGKTAADLIELIH
ncbi:hypothetical protein [Gemmiger sp. An194]|uniref:hypothetical protein n=1 Tax=Gemmiger sp. An194 TaxID=1965582 RepID=UPI000B3A08A3|nr:hypothetical protein [Gemmiger sp. An194]OUP24421.1 hypothetical protein B5F28_07245 [Gemmiger sp. An194]